MKSPQTPAYLPAMARALWLAVFSSAATWAAEPLPSVFGPGEQTTYAVRYLGLPAGMAQITVGWKMEQFGHQVWPLVCVGETTDLAVAYQLRDRFVSYWNPVTQAAVGADYFVDENRHRRRERYRYTADGRAIATRQREGAPSTEVEFAVDPGTLDLASATFSLRNAALEVGGTHQLPIFTGVKFYRMQATVDARETVTGPLGTFETFRVSVNGDFAGGLATKRNMTLWLTTDERHLPVKAEADFTLGSVVVEAVKYEAGRAFSGAR